MKLTYRDKILLIGAVVVIIWAIGIFLIIKPSFTTMSDTSKKKDSKDNEVITLQERVDAEKNLKDDLQKAYDSAVEHSNEYFYKLDTKEEVTDVIRELLYTSKREIVNTTYSIDDLSDIAVTPYDVKVAGDLNNASSLQQQVDAINGKVANDQAQATAQASVVATVSAYTINSDYECTLEELLAFADSLESTDQQSFIIQTIKIEDVNETGKIQGDMTFNYYMAPEVPKPAALGGDEKKDEKKDDDKKDDDSSAA